MRIKGSYIALAVLALISVGLIINALQQSQPYLTVSQVVEYSNRYTGREVSVLGVIADGPNSEDNLTLGFHLTDSQHSINVIYRGTLPQNFAIGTQAVVVGTLLSRDVIEASNILLKCPSKYGDGSQSSTGFDNAFYVILVVAVIVGASLLVFRLNSSRKRRK